MISCLNHDNLENAEEFYEWDKLIQKSYFRDLCQMSLLETEFKTSLKKDMTSDPPTFTISNFNIDYFIDKILTPYKSNKNIQNQYSWNVDVKIPQTQLTLSNLESDPTKQITVFSNYFGIYNSPDFMILRTMRISLLQNLITQVEISKFDSLHELISQANGLIKTISLKQILDLEKFHIHNKKNLIFSKRSNSLTDSENLYLAIFELENLDFEFSLFDSLIKWFEFAAKNTLNHEDLGKTIKSLGNYIFVVYN